MSLVRALRWLGIGLVAALLILQVVPYGRRHTNPPGRVEPRWDAPATRTLAVRACFDCHSNETVWPWYSHVAPISWDRPQKEARESAKTVRKGEMPPWFYVLLHPDARLTPAETQALIAGLEATLGTKGGKGRDDD
jgi:cytochrome c551/c552